MENILALSSGLWDKRERNWLISFWSLYFDSEEGFHIFHQAY